MDTLDISVNQSTDSDPIVISCLDENGDIFPLAGYTAFAEVRKCVCGEVVLNLSPAIESDDALGVITIPSINHGVSSLIKTGAYVWNLILQNEAGARLPEPIIGGRFTVNRTPTNPE